MAMALLSACAPTTLESDANPVPNGDVKPNSDRQKAPGKSQKGAGSGRAHCVDVTSMDHNWDNDMLCYRPNGKRFYTSYEGAARFKAKRAAKP